MRVIEPRQQPAREQKIKPPKKPWSRWRKALVVAFGLFVLLGILAWWTDQYPEESLANLVTGTHNAVEETANEKPKTIQSFSGKEFRDLYNTFAYPNTQEVETPPGITGNPEADQRIREIAEKRGYALRSIPVAPINKTDEPDLVGDDLLQPLALSGWQDLKKAAKNDGQPLRLLSGYRSIAYQREIFTQRLYAAGGNAIDIANGISDDIVDKVLQKTAPPGYSRHHTGYTIDVACYPNDAFVEFEKSTCFDWIRADNYRIAKKAGWIPSYPNKTTKQGPDPEPWEYVWVGVDSLKD